ncbi:Uncharacterized protein PECH_001271 [Penicillium ucsense]|uniref:CFEM domain-containing protein n=1 Tax=Penicillium ucsense TaxID=2839758 RepID=A0A8J8W3L6_9EURO|nr:Uncharacterized protein PECM_006623 [Penicillium ucsense]KAF7733014.1 Uncharacterized protein PECH_001271 [Penicillium ucsense]
MLGHLIRSILIALLSLIDYGSAVDSSDPSNAALWSAVPDCAKLCVQNFIEGQYNSAECTSGSDITCLCRTKTPSGLTLGEAGLSCLYALCAETDIASQGSRVYRMCSPVQGAIAETHSVIIATTFDPPPGLTKTANLSVPTYAPSNTASSPSTGPTIPLSSSSSSHSSSFSSRNTRSTNTVAQTTASTSGSISTSRDVGSSPLTATITATSSPTSSSVQSKGAVSPVSSSTVIGISVASGVAGVFLIGMAVFLCCKRRRQNEDDAGANLSHDDFFEIGGTMSEPPEFSRSPSRLSPSGPHGGPGGPLTNAYDHGSDEMSELPTTRTPTWQSQPTVPTVRLLPSDPVDTEGFHDREPIGVAVSSRDGWAHSPRSLISQKMHAESPSTTTASLHPKPLKWSHRPDSGGTLFEEEDDPRQIRLSHPFSVQGTPSVRALPGLPANPRAFKDGTRPSQYSRALPQPHTGPVPRNRLSPGGGVSDGRVVGLNLSTTAFRASPTPNPSSSSDNTSGSSSRGSASIPVGIAPHQGQAHRGQEHNTSMRHLHPSRPSLRSGFDARASSAQNGGMPRRPLQTIRPSQMQRDHTRTPNALGLSTSTDGSPQPRLVSREEIKHVQIRSSPRIPGEVVAPYCPDDLWPERGRSRAPAPNTMKELPYPSEMSSAKAVYPESPHKRPMDLQAQRLSATGRSLTPSKRGNDLILRVD